MARGPHGASRKSRGQARRVTAVGRGWEQLGRADSGVRFFAERRLDVETGHEASAAGIFGSGPVRIRDFRAPRDQRLASVAIDARGFRRHLRRMPSFPTCPHLPVPRPGLDWRTLHAFREGDRREAFYHACLEYGHALWQAGYSARALLCLDRAFGAELDGGEAVLGEHPLPYAAMTWLIAQTPPGVFLGNPRVHFQHYAGRMNEPRRDQRRWRAWACWALARVVRPDLPADPKHQVIEPTLEEIERALREYGHRGEPELWRTELAHAERLVVAGSARPGSADVLVS